MPDSWRPRQGRLERINRAQLSMIPGSMQGRIAEAAPSRPNNRGDADTSVDIEAVFSYPGSVSGDESPPYSNRNADVQIGTVIASVLSATGTSTYTVYVNGSSVGSVSVPSGNRQGGETVMDDGPVLGYGDLITVKATATGGANGATVQVLLTEIT